MSDFQVFAMGVVTTGRIQRTPADQNGKRRPGGFDQKNDRARGEMYVEIEAKWDDCANERGDAMGAVKIHFL